MKLNKEELKNLLEKVYALADRYGTMMVYVSHLSDDNKIVLANAENETETYSYNDASIDVEGGLLSLQKTEGGYELLTILSVISKRQLSAILDYKF